MSDHTTKESPKQPPSGTGIAPSDNGSASFWAGGAGGRTFKDWHLTRQFPAKGGEADVFLVSRGADQRVLKLYRYGISPKKEVFEGINRLTEKNAELFVRIFEFGEDPETGCFFELEEFVQGGNLADHLLAKKLDEAEVTRVVKKTAEALFVLHDNGILHLDLKPANILLRNTFPLDPVVSDFGISSVFDAQVSKKLTQTKGTSLYQSPESITGVVIPKSDWWSLGIITLELLIGRHPFEGLQRQVILYQLTTQGIEIPPGIDPRWRNLLMGLLTRNPDKRWGTDQIKRWLEGKTVETFYEEERAQASGKGGRGEREAGSSFRRFDIPFHLGDGSYNTLEEALEAMFSSAPRWEEGKAHLGRGTLATWLEENQDPERAGQLRRLAEEEPEGDSLVFRTGVYFRSDLPFTWRGALLDAEQLQSHLEKTADGLEAGDDRPLIESLFSGGIFQDYIRFTGKNLGKLDPFWKLAQGLKGSEFDRLSLAEKARIVLQALSGQFNVQQVFSTLHASFSENAASADQQFKLVQMKGFSAFAQKAGVWQPGDGEIWNMALKIHSRKGVLQRVDLTPFVRHTEQVVSAAKKDPSLREFLVRIFSKTGIDLNFIRQLQQFLSPHPWIDALIRGVYRLPEKESLDYCLGNLMVSGALGPRWADLNRKYVLPPFFEDLNKGKLVSPSQLKFAREILDQPEHLVLKSPDVPDWDSLTESAYAPVGVNPDSVEYLNFLKQERAKRTGRTIAGAIYSLVSLAVKVFLVLFFGMFFLELLFPFRPHGNRTQAREKSCYANMRVLLGAIEMYNMDNQAMITDQLPMDRLVTGGYLRSIPACPVTDGGYSILGDIASDGKIICNSHGTVD